MEFLLALLVGLLYAAGIYLLLRRSIIKLILGFVLIGNAVNLLIFTVGRVMKGHPPIINSSVTDNIYTDPIPQALILTAIVISFGVQAFAIILVKRAYKTVGTDDLDGMNTTDQFLYHKS